MKQGYFARLAGRSGLLSPQPFPPKPEAPAGVSGLETHVELESQSPSPVQSKTAQVVNIREPASVVMPSTRVEATDTDVPAGVRQEAGPLNELSLKSASTVSRHADLPGYPEATINGPLSTEGGIQEVRINDVASGHPDVQSQPLARQSTMVEAAVTPGPAGDVEPRDGITRSTPPKLPVQSIAEPSQETEASVSGDSLIMERRYVVDDSATTIERQTRLFPEQNPSPYAQVASPASHGTKTVSRSETTHRREPGANGYLQHSPATMEAHTPTVHIGKISVSVQAPAPKPAVTAAKPRRRGSGKPAASSPRLSRYYLRNI